MPGDRRGRWAGLTTRALLVGGLALVGTKEAATAQSVNAPLNILAGPQTPPRSALAAAGVARVSIGSSPARRTLYVLREIACSLRESDEFAYAREPSIPFDELNELFSHKI